MKDLLNKRICLRLDDQRYDQLASFAMKEGFSVSLVVRHLVCRFLEDQQRQTGGRHEPDAI